MGSALRAAREVAGDDLAGAVPAVSEQALQKLRFAELLPPRLAVAALASRGADIRGAAVVVSDPVDTLH